MNTFDYFTSLPIETQIDIMSSNPLYLNTSKLYYDNLYAKQQYIQKYCNLPVNRRELKTYLERERPHALAMYVYHDIYDFEVEHFHLINNKYKREFYVVNSIGESPNYFEIVAGRSEALYSIEQILSHFDYYATPIQPITFDFETTYNILSKRLCQSLIPRYSKTEIANFYNHIIDDLVIASDAMNKTQFFNYIVSIMKLLSNNYVLYHYDIIYYPLKSVVDIVALENIKFDMQGECITKELLQHYVDNINGKLEVELKKLDFILKLHIL